MIMIQKPLRNRTWYLLSFINSRMHLSTCAEEMKFEPVTLESLRSDKAFAKATKKHQKDIEAMKKRQQKEKATVQKNQVAAVEKIIKGKK